MESRSHSSFRLQDRLSGLAKRRNGLHSSCLQQACDIALEITEEEDNKTRTKGYYVDMDRKKTNGVTDDTRPSTISPGSTPDIPGRRR